MKQKTRECSKMQHLSSMRIVINKRLAIPLLDFGTLLESECEVMNPACIVESPGLSSEGVSLWTLLKVFIYDLCSVRDAIGRFFLRSGPKQDAQSSSFCPQNAREIDISTSTPPTHTHSLPITINTIRQMVSQHVSNPDH